MRPFWILILAMAALLSFVAAEAQAQRGGRGGGGMSFGVGPGGISVGDGRTGVTFGDGGMSYGSANRGYGYGSGYGNSGYGRGGYGYGNNYYGNGYGYDNGYGYNNGYYVQPRVQYSVQPTYQAAAPYRGTGVAIRNPSDETLTFTVNDSRQMQVKAGDTVRLTESGQFTVSFDRGGDMGMARYTIREGLYEFTATDKGWELYRQKADVGVAASTPRNPTANPRTEVLKPVVDEEAVPPVPADEKPE